MENPQKRTVRFFLVLLAIACSSGCMSTHYDLYKPEAKEEDFTRDQTECRRTMGLGGPNRFDPSQILGFVVERYREEMVRCLQGKGWKPRPD